MAADYVAKVRAAYAAWNAGDLDAAFDLAHPEIEVVQDPELPGATRTSGSPAFRAWLDSFFDTWESFQIEPTEVRQVDNRVLVVAHVSARGKSTGIPVETETAHVLSMEDGLAIRWESYTDVSRAREALS